VASKEIGDKGQRICPQTIFCKTKCEDCKIEQSGRIIIYVMARGPVEAPNRVRSIG